MHDPIPSNQNGPQPLSIKEKLLECRKTCTSIKNKLLPHKIFRKPGSIIDADMVNTFINELTPYLELFYNATQEEGLLSDEDIDFITKACGNCPNEVYEDIRKAVDYLSVTLPLYPKHKKDSGSKYLLEIRENLENCRKALVSVLNTTKNA